MTQHMKADREGCVQSIRHTALDGGPLHLYSIIMKTMYSVTEAQAKLPGLLREAQGAPITITRHNQAVAYVISKERMDAIQETLEILASPEAMKAIRAARDKRTRYTPLHEALKD
jgi:prevent-host-death family protein